MDRLFGRLLGLLNVAASLWVLAIMAIVGADVIGRTFNAPLFGVPEIVKVSIVCIVWLQMAYTLRADQHLRSHLIFGALPRPGQRLVYGLNCLAGLVVFGLIVFYTWDDAIETFQDGTFEGEHPVRIPVWPVWTILVLGATLTAVEYLRQAVRSLLADRLPDDDWHPVDPASEVAEAGDRVDAPRPRG